LPDVEIDPQALLALAVQPNWLLETVQVTAGLLFGETAALKA